IVDGCSREQTARPQTPRHGTQIETKRARAFPDGRYLLRHWPAQTRHPASEAGHGIGSGIRRSALSARPAVPGNELASKSPGMFQDGSSLESEGNALSQTRAQL